jgi:hypothetical protein
MFKRGDRLEAKSSITKKDLQRIGFYGCGSDKILAGDIEFLSEKYMGDDGKCRIHVMGYGSCWIWKDWIQLKSRQLTFIFKE